MIDEGSMSGVAAAAMRDAGLSRIDERGLMQLDEARGIVGAVSEFRKGMGRMIGRSWVLDSDRFWAALLSLGDASEFVREATRLRWFFHPRGRDNTAPIERYREAILPWLASFVRSDGRLVNVPWCVVPCLMQLGAEQVLDLLWRVKAVSDEADGGDGPARSPPMISATWIAARGSGSTSPPPPSRMMTPMGWCSAG